MKDNYFLNGSSENYKKSLEWDKKNINKIHFENENLNYNLMNRTQTLLDHSFNIIKSQSKGNLEKLKELSLIPNQDHPNNRSEDNFLHKQQDQSNIKLN
jgi:hypothetical protein